MSHTEQLALIESLLAEAKSGVDALGEHHSLAEIALKEASVELDLATSELAVVKERR